MIENESISEGDDVVPVVPIVETTGDRVLACSACGVALAASDKKPGLKIFCRYCGALTVIPNLDGEEATVAPTSLQLPTLTSLIYPGVLNFPFYSGCRSRLLSMTVMGTVALMTGTYGIGATGSLGGAIAGICAIVLAFVLSVGASTVMSVFLLRVLGDTAEGSDAIENLPDAVWIDSILESLFIFNSLAISAIPGFVIGLIVSRGHAPQIGSVGIFLLFPIVLLSMQEANSATQVLSLSVARSLVRVWWAWTTFYVLTAFLLLAAGTLSDLMMQLPMVIGLLLSVGALVYCAMVYFRILGRLTRFIASAK